MQRVSKNERKGKRKGLLAKAPLGVFSAVLLAGAIGAIPASADPAGAPNNTGTGQTASSNSTSSGNSGSDSSDDDNQDERDRREALRQKHEAETRAREAAEAQNNKPKPPSEPTPGLPSDNVVADLLPTPPTQKVPGLTRDQQNNVIYGDVGILINIIQQGDGKPANDPFRGTVRSAVSKCDFKSGTHNLDDTRAMFPERCGEEWHPELHKCDYNSDGWRCYSL